MKILRETHLKWISQITILSYILACWASSVAFLLLVPNSWGAGSFPILLKLYPHLALYSLFFALLGIYFLYSRQYLFHKKWHDKVVMGTLGVLILEILVRVAFPFKLATIHTLPILITLFLVSFLYKKNKDEGSHIRNTPLHYIAYFASVIIPISIPLYSFIHLFYTDYNFSRVQAEVSYKIYKPRLIPGSRSNFSNYELSNDKKLVHVLFDKFPVVMNGEYQNDSIILQVIGVESKKQEFYQKLNELKLNENKSKTSTIYNIKISKDHTATLMRHTLDNGNTYTKLYFETIDNTLVHILGGKATSEDDLLQFANSLE